MTLGACCRRSSPRPSEELRVWRRCPASRVSCMPLFTCTPALWHWAKVVQDENAKLVYEKLKETKRVVEEASSTSTRALTQLEQAEKEKTEVRRCNLNLLDTRG